MRAGDEGVGRSPACTSRISSSTQVRTASQSSMRSGDETATMIYSLREVVTREMVTCGHICVWRGGYAHHMYAKMEYAEVVRKTPSCLIERTSPSGRQTMHTPVIT